MVERSAHNRLVAGSIPAGPTIAVPKSLELVSSTIMAQRIYILDEIAVWVVAAVTTLI